MFLDEYRTMKERLHSKRQTVLFSILSLLYFGLYTLVSIVLGTIVSDAATIIGFWALNLLSTYVYMRLFFYTIAAMRQEESVILFSQCIGMLAVESVLFGFTILLYYAFVYWLHWYAFLAFFVYVYVFFCTSFQLFCFYAVYRGARTPKAIVADSLQGMKKAWKGVIAAAASLALGYCVLYICSMGVDVTLQILQPHVLILNIGVTMNRWMEAGTVLLTMFMSGLFDSTLLLFLAYQVIAALLFSYFYCLWMAWICRLCETSWNWKS